jgi:two-component system, NtrC family, sensor kinase
MGYRILSIVIFSFLIGIKSLLAGNQHIADSLLYLIKNDKIEDDAEKYLAICQLVENTADANIILNYSERAIQLAEKIHISPARSIISKGAGYLQIGKLTMALECFIRAADYYKAEKNIIGLATVYSYISAAYVSQQNHANATYYFKKAIEIFSREKDSVRLASSLHNLGYEYYRVAEYDSALYLFLKTGEIYKKLGYDKEYAYCIGNSGLVYAKQLKPEKAEGNLLKAIEILNKYGDEAAVTEYVIAYANILEQKGEIRKAIDFTNRSYFTADKNNSQELKRDAAYQLARLYQHTNRFDSAYHYLSVYITYDDSIKNYRNVQEMADLRTEFEVSKKQAEVDILEKEKTTQGIIIGSLILIIILASGLIILYYIILKRNRKFTSILDERNKLLEHQSTELKELNRIKDRFFSIVSHDLRGPISSLGGISTLLKESAQTDNKALLLEISDYIDQTVFSLTGLLENLLNWAMSQQGQLMLKQEKVELKTTIYEVVQIFATVAISKDIHIDLRLDDKVCIAGDRNSIMMILRNLISNALKFTNRGGEISITSSLNNSGFVEIIIHDNGIGIPKEKLANLFELKEDKSTWGTDKEKGIGLGLTLVYEFVQLHKGSIAVKSTVGKETSFILQFPVIE